MAAGSSPEASAAYNGPTGTASVPVGTATYHFLNVPLSFRFVEFLGVAFIVFIAARHWGKFINKVVVG